MSNIEHVKYIPNKSEYIHFAVRILQTILFSKNKDNPEMKTLELLAKFKDLTSLDFNIFLKNLNLNFEDFILKNQYREFDFNNGLIRYRNVFEEISRIESLKIPRYLGKNKYITRPIENSSLHIGLNSSKTHKNNLSSFSERKKEIKNDKVNFSLENEIRRDNAFNNNIGIINDSMNCGERKMFDMSLEIGKNQSMFSENDYYEGNRNQNTLMEIDYEQNNNFNDTMITVNLCEEDEDESYNANILKDILVNN